MTSCTLGLMKEQDLVLKMRAREIHDNTHEARSDGWIDGKVIFNYFSAALKSLADCTLVRVVHELLTQKEKVIEVL